MTTAAVIVAAGRGASLERPSPWSALGGLTLVARSLAALRAVPSIGPIRLVLASEDIDMAAGYSGQTDLAVVAGGPAWIDAVRAGIEALADIAPARVLIHDVARPFPTPGLIEAVDAALSDAAGAAPVLRSADPLWTVEDGRLAGTGSHDSIAHVQTPRGYRYADILAACRAHGSDQTDDLGAAFAAGLDVVAVPGDEGNILLGRPEDFARAETLLETTLDVRSGTGFDVHRFGPGDRVVLCGVEVPHDAALRGHSDADVGLHAITDAIYGALAEGDIGRHFPPSDPQWKGTASHVFLEHAAARAALRGYRITSIDCTFICERPKIAPHADAMVERVAAIVGIEPGRVSVKATTSEGLGFTGRGEGIAAMASVTVVAD